MLSARLTRTRFLWLRRHSETRARSYCSSNDKNGSRKGNGADPSGDGTDKGSSLRNYSDTYKKLDNLDFTTAAKILFSEPTKKKRFGFDFHLVQFFFACMPSLAAYLVAQYARYEMRKMEAEEEAKKKKQEEVEKAKALEEEAAEEKKKAGAEREIQEVKERLSKLEQTVKEVAIDSKKSSLPSSDKTTDAVDTRESREAPRPGSSDKESEPGSSTDRGSVTKEGRSSPGQVSASSKTDR